MSTNSLSKVRQQLEKLEAKMLHVIKDKQAIWNEVHPGQRLAAGNLLHYLRLRNEDIRDLQDLLHIHGLSSMASSEGHIHRQIQSILQRLGKTYHPGELDRCTYALSCKQIQLVSEMLFGKNTNPAIPYIMVTFDASFTENYKLIKKLLQQGMNVARINCAHDDESIWIKLIRQIKKACRSTGLPCKIYMDLAGPKIRTLLLSKGDSDGKVKINEGQFIWLAEKYTGFKKNEIVISINEPGVLSGLKKGEQVLIDDGLVRGIIEEISPGWAKVRLTRIASKKNKISSGKGVNFPDSNLSIPSLTDHDQRCLPFICDHADLIGYSFVRNPSDLKRLQDMLFLRGSEPPKIIIKVETPEAVKNLPALLLQGMQDRAFGVMIARGDLAVEIGFMSLL